MAKKFDELALVEEYRKCERCRIVAEKCGCSAETVRRALIKHNEPRTKRHPREITKPRATEQELIAIVGEYHSGGATICELAKKHHRAQSTISDAIKKYSDGLKRCEVNAEKITDAQLLEEVKTLTRREIAEKHNMHVESVARRMRKLGVHAVHEPPSNGSENIKSKFGDCWHYVESHKRKCEKLHPDFEYMESRTKSRKSREIRLKCKICGEVLERSMSAVMRYNTRCENCKEIQNARRELVRVLLEVKKMRTPRTCAECGETFFSKYDGQKYCSERCKRNRQKNRTSYRKRCRHYGVYYDPSVTRKKVIERDGNTCQICGEPCDENDRGWGTIGAKFPTLDHIIPLAKGGAHTWDNVQCAHAICNSYKRDLTENGADEKCS